MNVVVAVLHCAHELAGVAEVFVELVLRTEFVPSGLGHRLRGKYRNARRKMRPQGKENHDAHHREHPGRCCSSWRLTPALLMSQSLCRCCVVQRQRTLFWYAGLSESRVRHLAM